MNYSASSKSNSALWGINQLDETYRMHDTSVMKIILLDNMRGCTIYQTSESRTSSEIQGAIDQFAFPTGRAHL